MEEDLLLCLHQCIKVTQESNYTDLFNRWANQLKVPIFSIDYKKAPENRYPHALNDVWQSYNWIV